MASRKKSKYWEVYRRPAGYFAPYVATLAPLFAPPARLKIIDIGCGYGDFLTQWRKVLGKRAHYLGVTVAEHEADFIARKKPFIDVQKIPQEVMSRRAEKFQNADLIINYHTLSYIPPPQQLQVAKTMLRFLKPNGYLLLALIDDWVQFRWGLIQQGEGFQQYAYSPLLFWHLNRQADLVWETFDQANNYHLFLWKKREVRFPWPAFIMGLRYFLRNNLLLVPHYDRVQQYLYERLGRRRPSR